MRPKLSYTVWFSQRNGSSLLCEGLTSTGIAGKPGEHFHNLSISQSDEWIKLENPPARQEEIWKNGSTPNGVFGLKVNAPRLKNDLLINELEQWPGGDRARNHYEIWENAFPNGKHIFLMRRNKVRQAVSWWKAIITSEWHLKNGEKSRFQPQGIRDRYEFDALRHLLIEATFRESKIQDFLNLGKIVPLTIVYEDFIADYEGTIRKIIDYLGVADGPYSVAPPHYTPTADDELTEEWVDRFRTEMQKGWQVAAW